MNEVNANKTRLNKPNYKQIDLEKKLNTTISQLLIPNVNDLSSNSKHIIQLTNKANKNISLISEYNKELKYRCNKIEKKKIEIKKLKEALLLKRSQKDEVNNIIRSYLNLLQSNNFSINNQFDNLQSKEVSLMVKEHYLNQLLPTTIPTDEESQSLLGDTRNYYTEFNVSQTGFIHNFNNSDSLIDPPLGVTVTNKEDFLNISLTQGNIIELIQSYNHDRQLFKNKSNKLPFKKCKSFEHLTRQRLQSNKMNIKKCKVSILKETKQEIIPIKERQNNNDTFLIKNDGSKIIKIKKNEINKTNISKVNKEELKAISDKVLNASGINQVIEEFNLLNESSNLFISKNYSSKNKEKKNQKVKTKTVNEEEKNNNHQYDNNIDIQNKPKESIKCSGVFKKSNQIEYAHQRLKQFLIESKNNRYGNTLSTKASDPYNKSNKRNDPMNIIQKYPQTFKSPITHHSQINKSLNINNEFTSSLKNLSHKKENLTNTPSEKDISHNNNAKPQILFDYNLFISFLFDKLITPLYILNSKFFLNQISCYEKDYKTTFTFKDKKINRQKAKYSMKEIVLQYYFNKQLFPSIVNILYCSIQNYNENIKKKTKSSPSNLSKEAESENIASIQMELKEKSVDNQTEKTYSIDKSELIKEKATKINLVQIEHYSEENELPKSNNDLKQYENSLKIIKEITKATQEIETKIKSFANQMLNIP